MAKKDGQAAPPKPERQRPAHECRIGRIRATIWQNHHETQGNWYSITLTRSYKDGEGHWKSASSFGRDDLLVLGEVTRMAFHWIHRQYQEKNNGAGQKEESPDASSPNQDEEIPF
jgi:hypothetical protein